MAVGEYAKTGARTKMREGGRGQGEKFLSICACINYLGIPYEVFS